eukprot:scaffold249710_cov26-Tisochrysis_lutea.AAC.2
MVPALASAISLAIAGMYRYSMPHQSSGALVAAGAVASLGLPSRWMREASATTRATSSTVVASGFSTSRCSRVGSSSSTSSLAWLSLGVQRSR